MRDEGCYLMEWLEFHKLVGVERFYLYNNNSVDNTQDIVIPYIQTGEVIFHDWPMHPGQISAYEHCLKHYGRESEWMAFIDLDEFLFATEKNDIREVLEEFKDYPAVVVNWLCFGSSGHIKKPKGLQIENYTKRAPDNFPSQKDGSKSIKSIIRPEQTLGSGGTPHDFTYSAGWAVTENKKPVSGPLSTMHSIKKLRLNHYKTRSKEDSDYKTKRGRATTLLPRNPGLFKAHDRNDIEDLTIQRFLPQLKNAIAERERILNYELLLKQQAQTPNQLAFDYQESDLIDFSNSKLKRSFQQLQQIQKELAQSKSWLDHLEDTSLIVSN
ncbi:glycosyltransferase family 92 protein [Limnospira fusiformis]|uniref:glycosyltransferase family 92 protein n=1 Tax=Limnospira fusiformis TaxID=54297 RepID=UPI0034E0C456